MTKVIVVYDIDQSNALYRNNNCKSLLLSSYRIFKVLILWIVVEKKKERSLADFEKQPNYVFLLLVYGGGAGSPGTGHATVAAALSIEFRAQLLLVDSPLPTFFCFISCSVFVSDSSPPSYVAYADVENIPVNPAAIKTVAIAIVLFITNK